MLSQRLLDELNEQLKYEFYSAHFYLALAGYCASQDLDGFANFFIVQAEEEKFHAMRIFNFINEMNGRVVLTAIEAPPNEYGSILEAFEKAFEHEQFVTKRIYHLMDVAMEEKEHATMSFLKWFIDEQVEEGVTFGNIKKKLRFIGNDINALFTLDTELAQRTFVLPTIK